MARKKIREALEAKRAGIRKWTYEVTEKPGEYKGRVKDENGRCVLEIREDIDYNTLSRLLNTNKYMTHKHDMKGLALYLWDRGLVPMTPEEKEEWKKRKLVPIEVKEIIL